MPRLFPAALLVALALAVPARAQEAAKDFPKPAALVSDRVKDVPALTPGDAASLKPGTVLFTDHREAASTNPESGLIAFEAWRKARGPEAAALSPWPGYTEPDYTQTVNGVAKPRHETLKVYVAEGRFVVAKPPSAIDLSAFANLDFLAKMDPVIRHKRLEPAEVTPTRTRPPPSPSVPTGLGAGRAASASSRATISRASCRSA